MILVTGATGTVGRSTVAALKASGVRFKVGVRNPDKAKDLRAEWVPFDYDQFDSYVPAFQGVEKIFFVTPVSDRAPGYAAQTLAAAKRAGVKHIVRLSVFGCDFEPGIALGRSHFAIEKDIRASGIPWTFLRPSSFMQNFVNYYGCDPSKDSQIFLPHGEGKANWVDARDVGAVAAKVLTTPGHEGKVYNLTGPEAWKDAECASFLSQAWSRNISYVDVPENMARQALEGLKYPYWLVDAFGELNATIKAGYSSTVTPGVQDVLGRPPRNFATWAKDWAAGARW